MMSRKIIFQALNWKIKDVNNHLEEIKEVGFNTIQLSPLQGIKENNYDFWVYYQLLNKFIYEYETLIHHMENTIYYLHYPYKLFHNQD